MFHISVCGLCHIISLYCTKTLVQLWVLKQFSPSDSPTATPAAVRSLTSASHFTVFINCLSIQRGYYNSAMVA